MRESTCQALPIQPGWNLVSQSRHLLGPAGESGACALSPVRQGPRSETGKFLQNGPFAQGLQAGKGQTQAILYDCLQET
jgi:hypothetical protein